MSFYFEETAVRAIRDAKMLSEIEARKLVRERKKLVLHLSNKPEIKKHRSFKMAIWFFLAEVPKISDRDREDAFFFERSL